MIVPFAFSTRLNESLGGEPTPKLVKPEEPFLPAIKNAFAKSETLISASFQKRERILCVKKP